MSGTNSESDDKGGTLVDCTFCFDGAAHSFHLCFDQKKADTAGVLVIVESLVEAKEIVPDFFQVDSKSIIGHPEDYRLVYQDIDQPTGSLAEGVTEVTGFLEGERYLIALLNRF